MLQWFWSSVVLTGNPTCSFVYDGTIAFWSSVVLTGNSAPGARSRYGGSCIDPYAFKDYGGYAYELMSMGLETLYRLPGDISGTPGR